MSTKKATKRALLTSILAICMCLVMLVGSTFAWFTDTASTGVNTITSGNLHVAIRDEADTNDIATLDWVAADSRAQNEILWEPGCTYTLTPFVVKNTGSLALKYKLVVTGLEGDADLLDVIKFSYEIKTNSETKVLDLNEEGHLLPGAVSGVITVSAHMDEAAGNTYQDKTLENVKITVYATQDTVENDSYGNQYDKDATYPAYPDGVTKDNFDEVTSVEYTNNLGDVVTGNKPAVAAYVDASGNVKYVGDIWAAIKSNASAIYCKEDATLRMREREVDTNRTPDLTNDLTIYANGADFQYGQISVNMTAEGKATPLTVKVYDAKNIEVWGLTPNDGVTQTIIMENCTNIGKTATGDAGILLYITGNTGTVNATVKNCHIEKNSSGIYMSTNGSLTVTNSTFVGCASGIKTSYKGNATRVDKIENCSFIKCGCTTEMANGTSWLSDDSAAFKYKIGSGASGTLSLTLKNNTITGTIGDKGDTQIADGVTVVNE